MNIAGCTIETVVLQTRGVTLYRAHDTVSNQPVLVKALTDDHPAAHDITLLRREFETTRGLDTRFVITAKRLERYENGIALVMEWFDRSFVHDKVQR